MASKIAAINSTLVDLSLAMHDLEEAAHGDPHAFMHERVMLKICHERLIEAREAHLVSSASGIHV